jgi:hypothetical protein
MEVSRKLFRRSAETQFEVEIVSVTLSTVAKDKFVRPHGVQRVGFVTAAVFEAVIVHRWQNEFKKTKLYTNTSPAAGTNLVLVAVWPFSKFHSKPALLSLVNLYQALFVEVRWGIFHFPICPPTLY